MWQGDVSLATFSTGKGLSSILIETVLVNKINTQEPSPCASCVRGQHNMLPLQDTGYRIKNVDAAALIKVGFVRVAYHATQGGSVSEYRKE